MQVKDRLLTSCPREHQKRSHIKPLKCNAVGCNFDSDESSMKRHIKKHKDQSMKLDRKKDWKTFLRDKLIGRAKTVGSINQIMRAATIEDMRRLPEHTKLDEQELEHVHGEAVHDRIPSPAESADVPSRTHDNLGRMSSEVTEDIPAPERQAFAVVTKDGSLYPDSPAPLGPGNATQSGNHVTESYVDREMDAAYIALGFAVYCRRKNLTVNEDSARQYIKQYLPQLQPAILVNVALNELVVASRVIGESPRPRKQFLSKFHEGLTILEAQPLTIIPDIHNPEPAATMQPMPHGEITSTPTSAFSGLSPSCVLELAPDVSVDDTSSSSVGSATCSSAWQDDGGKETAPTSISDNLRPKENFLLTPRVSSTDPGSTSHMSGFVDEEAQLMKKDTGMMWDDNFGYVRNHAPNAPESTPVPASDTLLDVEPPGLTLTLLSSPTDFSPSKTPEALAIRNQGSGSVAPEDLQMSSQGCTEIPYPPGHEEDSASHQTSLD